MVELFIVKREDPADGCEHASSPRISRFSRWPPFASSASVKHSLQTFNPHITIPIPWLSSSSANKKSSLKHPCCHPLTDSRLSAQHFFHMQCRQFLTTTRPPPSPIKLLAEYLSTLYYPGAQAIITLMIFYYTTPHTNPIQPSLQHPRQFKPNQTKTHRLARLASTTAAPPSQLPPNSNSPPIPPCRVHTTKCPLHPYPNRPTSTSSPTTDLPSFPPPPPPPPPSVTAAAAAYGEQ